MNSDSFVDKKDNFISNLEKCLKQGKESGTLEISLKRGKLKRKFRRLEKF